MTELNFRGKIQQTKIYISNSFVNEKWSFLDHSKKYFLITDGNINNLYASLLSKIPNLLGTYIITPGDENKNFSTYLQILSTLSKINLTKSDYLLSVGGGVVSDITGFVAGTYKRGIPYLSIPTSLIGMVDASIGGKCGLNFEQKNQVGMFYHPEKIFIDTSWLTTLPFNNLNDGWAEIIKIATTSSKLLFDELMKCNLDSFIDPKAYLPFITDAIKIKLDYAIQDEFDQSTRHILNFGHTIGHIIETMSNYEISHGKAVAMGMISECSDPEINKKIIFLLKKFSLFNEIPHYDYMNKIMNDKKVQDNKLSLIKITKIGESTIIKIRKEDLSNEYFWKKY